MLDQAGTGGPLPAVPTKRRTKASIARDKGLEPLAITILTDAANIINLDAVAQPFVNAEAGISTAQEALEGAGHIIAERVADEADIRQWMRQRLWQQGTLATKVKKGATDPEGKYADYYDFAQTIHKLPSHRVLAINRAERERDHRRPGGLEPRGTELHPAAAGTQDNLSNRTIPACRLCGCL
jgi:uncharacterized protein